jgi:hypothetical protein
MIVKVTDRIFDEDEMRMEFNVEVDGKTEAGFLDGESEDANISRDFADVYSIPSLMQKAYEAGKNGDSFEIIHVGGGRLNGGS